ncbi:hypothetical protein AYO44_16410 [Planctomycetaceae bacterium SCGC AG-212-F19]|nr:hypothetical protein AYO44_16410 [Planctomycetaceae bacterium SCGC AG-212-F19]
MSWTSFKSAVGSIFSQQSARNRRAVRRPAIRPDVESLEERAVPSTYTTNFPLTENPISEGGRWINGRAMRTSGGLAFGTQSGVGGPPYDDSSAVLTGAWGPDQAVWATVHTVNQQGGTNIYEEVELNVRMTITQTSIAGYDVDFRCAHDGSQYVELGYWRGTPDSVISIEGTLLAQVRGSAAPGLYDGDVIKMTAIGNVITVYQNGAQILQVIDNAHPTTGSPGMGQWMHGPVGLITDFGLTSFTATDEIGPSVPPTPTGLAAVAGNAQVLLAWAASSGATSYNIYRSTTSGGEGATPYRTGVTTTSFTDTGLANGTTYYYQVSAVNSAGESAKSGEASAIPILAPPLAPTNLMATTGTAQVSLSWTGASGATSYKVYRGTTSGGETLLASPGGTGTTYTDTTATNGITYFYKVAAVNAGGTSPLSNEASGTPQAAGTLVLAIDAGGPAAGSFVADTDFSGGSVSGGTTAAINTSQVINPAPQSVWQSGRYGNMTYTIPNLTPGASYSVRLDFVEYFFGSAGQRVFNVALNGTQVLSNFDIFAAAGGTNIALARSFTATASSSGTITIAFTSLVNNAMINGIEVFSGSATSNQPPTVAAAPSASPSPVGGTTTNLSVLGADDGGESNLTYTWAAASVPTGATPSFSVNGTNAAKNTSVTLNKAGSYTFQATITDAGRQTATSTVNVTVNQSLTSLVLSPASATVADGATQQFSATGKDQFGNALTTQPAFSWSIDSGGIGSISTSGLYTAPASGTGTATVRASSGSVGGTASVSVTAAAPFIAHINFTSNPATTPAGYLSDSGAAFGNRGNALSYGWSADNSVNARDRNAGNSPDELHDSLIHMQTPSTGAMTYTWSIAVPNGTYTVHVGVGDPAYADIVSKLTVNGILTINGTTSSSHHWLEGTTTLTVSNGLLTVAEQAGAYDKIDFIDITQGSPEMLAGTPIANSDAANLQEVQLQRVIADAIQRWAATGLSAEQVSILQHAQVVIADLPGGLLGYTLGNVVTIDTNAAGYGWSLGQHVSPHRVDLLTVVCHEFGNVLGLPELRGEHQQPGNVMDDTLALGVRWQPFGL